MRTGHRATRRRFRLGGGSRVAAEDTRRTIERLRTVIEEQQQQIAQMAERLARYENGSAP